MTEAQLYEKIGRLALENEDRKASYALLLDLLAKVVAGEIAVDRVIVNLTDQTWGYAEFGATPAAPATINGLPRCVVAPPPQEQAGFYDDVGPVVITGRQLFIRRVEDTARNRVEEAFAELKAKNGDGA